jgi:hypothetical protein
VSNLDFGEMHTLWGIGGRGGRIFYLVTLDEQFIQVPPGWYPREAFEPTEIQLPPFWIFRIAPVFVSGSDTGSWDWVIGDQYLLRTADRLLRLVDVEPEEFRKFRIHASQTDQLRLKWEARARIDALEGDLTSDQTVEALALVEAGEFELLQPIIGEVTKNR